MTYDVVLYAADMERRDPTGLGRYALNLTRRLIAASAVDSVRYTAAGSTVRAPLRAKSVGFDVLHPPIPRRILHPAWCVLRRPLLDRWISRSDLIHVLYPATPVPTRAKVVYTIHDVFPITHPEWFTRKSRWLFKAALQDALERSTLLIANSHATSHELVDKLGVDPSRIHVVPMAIDDSFFVPLTEEGIRTICDAHGVKPGHYLITVGGVNARKNLSPLLEALSNLKARRQLPLLIVGPAERGHESVTEQAQGLGLEALVRFTGWIPDHHLPVLLAGAVALVHPAADEGFGMTPLEAMAVGAPTIVSSAGALPEVTAGASLGADPFDASAWERSIEQVLDDPQVRASLVERGTAVAAGHTWEGVAEQTRKLHLLALEQ